MSFPDHALHYHYSLTIEPINSVQQVMCKTKCGPNAESCATRLQKFFKTSIMFLDTLHLDVEFWNAFFGSPFSCFVMALLISGMPTKRFPFSADFIFEKN